jgi:hypothetical protein
MENCFARTGSRFRYQLIVVTQDSGDILKLQNYREPNFHLDLHVRYQKMAQ